MCCCEAGVSLVEPQHAGPGVLQAPLAGHLFGSVAPGGAAARLLLVASKWEGPVHALRAPCLRCCCRNGLAGGAGWRAGAILVCCGGVGVAGVSAVTGAGLVVAAATAASMTLGMSAAILGSAASWWLHIIKDGAGEGCRQRYRFRILGSSGGLSRWLVCWGSSTGSSGIDCLLVALHIVKDGAGEGCCQRCRFRSGDGRSRLLVCWGSGSQWCAICSVILHAVVC